MHDLETIVRRNADVTRQSAAPFVVIERVGMNAINAHGFDDEALAEAKLSDLKQQPMDNSYRLR